MKTTSDAAMDPGILKHPDKTSYTNMLQKPITYMYRVYITLPLQGRHKHLASQSQYPYGSYTYTSDTSVLGGRRTTIMMMMTRVKIDIYVFTLS